MDKKEISNWVDDFIKSCSLNKEYIPEGVREEFIDSAYSYEKSLHTEISKLKKQLKDVKCLDKKKVKELYKKYVGGIFYPTEFITAILSLAIPGEVIAEGEVKYSRHGAQIFVGDKELEDIGEDLSEKLEDYQGEDIKLILIKK